MSSLLYTASDVMDSAAALLNDTQKQEYTYAVQLPYLKRAFRELREELQLGNVPITNKVGTVLTIPAGVVEISATTIPGLPPDLVEIRQLFSRHAGTGSWIPMSRHEYLSFPLDNVTVGYFNGWAWSGNSIRLSPSNQINDLKIDYISEGTNVVDENSAIPVINGRTYLESRTAALCAQYIGEDKPRADDLNVDASIALERIVMIESKAKQTIMTRRQPFRAGWKSRGY